MRRPNSKVVRPPGVRRAADSVVKVLGDAPSCSKTLEGSGFVYAPHRVMTNAHVVAGVEHLVVRLDDTDHAATVVYYDPDIDVAVLAVPDLDARALTFAGEAGLGRPGGRARLSRRTVPSTRSRAGSGARSACGARTSTATAASSATPTRSTHWSGRATPVARWSRPSGQVLGVVFAASLIDGSTGYALTAGEVVGGCGRRQTLSPRRVHRCLRPLTASRAAPG